MADRRRVAVIIRVVAGVVLSGLTACRAFEARFGAPGCRFARLHA
jgi:hypothetical protein